MGRRCSAGALVIAAALGAAAHVSLTRWISGLRVS
jgi:hypothetical protein